MVADKHRAERFDDALNRLHDGQVETIDDRELRSLVEFAARLERELPEDLPDPDFRMRLKQQLIQAEAPATADAPKAVLVDLSTRHSPFWQRLSWRYSVVGSALAALLVLGVIFGWNQFTRESDTSPGRETAIAAVGTQETTSTAEDAEGSQAMKAPEQTDPSETEEPQTFADTSVFPPLDDEHVVQIPGGLGASGGFEPAPSGTPEPGITLPNSIPTLPESIVTWRLAAPLEPEVFLETVMARLGISGEIQQEAVGGDTVVYNVIDESGFPVLFWEPARAFFSFNRNADLLTPPPQRGESPPVETARHWLEEIGYDMVSIQYGGAILSESDVTLVEFSPLGLTGRVWPGPGVGMTVGVSDDGAIQFANGNWFSLVEGSEVPLRPMEEVLAAFEAGEGYATVVGHPENRDSVTVEWIEFGYLLTRSDEDESYLLHPVVAFNSRVGPNQIPATVYVSALDR